MAEGTGKGRAPRGAYAASGVDVAAGDRAVELLRQVVLGSRRRAEVIGGLGGFGAAFAVPSGYRDPVLVAATDGVGTKTEIAAQVGRLASIGLDLVAMCADDVVCSGAEPLFFLDYLAIGRLDPRAVAELVGGIAAGCEAAGCALIGGETAEHPGVMEVGAFDLAGFCLGIVERASLLDASTAQAGDVVVGLPS
ncbi:MAG TPA: AIR synthase related protein, partial [Candidatus Limnocylindrales bacterium]|nr:AIR synthase related protein [Candidatus Limnocylindrales bacterium]